MLGRFGARGKRGNQSPSKRDCGAGLSYLLHFKHRFLIFETLNVELQRCAQFDIAIERHLAACVDIGAAFGEEKRLARQLVE